MEARPFTMFHLHRQSPGKWGVMDIGPGADHIVATHDPEHVKSSQRIERHQPGAGVSTARGRAIHRSQYVINAAASSTAITHQNQWMPRGTGLLPPNSRLTDRKSTRLNSSHLGISYA